MSSLVWMDGLYLVEAELEQLAAVRTGLLAVRTGVGQVFLQVLPL